MRNIIEISKKALQSNFASFRAHAKESLVAPILKSNAYGHGLKEVYSILKDQNPKIIGLNYLFEGEQLRELGYRGRIFLVGPIHPDDLPKAQSLEIEVTVGDLEILSAWSKLVHRPKAHIKIDTGMSRQGFLPIHVDAVLTRLSPLQSDLLGVFSHFSNVEDVTEQAYAQKQLKIFKNVCEKFQNRGFRLEQHMASSASILIMKESLFNISRLGISLFGLWPSQATRLSFKQIEGDLMDLSPVLSWRTEVASIKEVKAGFFIGYGCTYKALKDMVIAVVPVGYYEGYPRLASNHQEAHVLLKGQRCPVVGRICMNMMMVDISHISNVKAGDRITLLGQDQDEHIHAAQLASWAETIHYELLTRLNPDIPRVIVE